MKILNSYSKISLDLMAQLLEFKTTLALQKWIINLPGEKVFYIEGNEVIIPKDLKAEKLNSIVKSLDQAKHSSE